MNFVGKEDELHDMVWDIAKTGFSMSDPPNHVEELGLPTSQSGVHVIKKELEISQFRRLLKHWEAKIFPKGSTSLDTQDGGETVLSDMATVGGKDDLKIEKVSLLSRMGAKSIKDLDNGVPKSRICFSK